ncbi:MAG TPA: hypothetical protein VMN78_00365 [Longimicrobiales bacterium]|nr:hypothetical protein [Longimicrobiales bacterium]
MSDEASTRLLIGTKRGLFIADSDAAREQWRLSTPRLEGREVYFATRDARDGALWAATRHRVWGAHLHTSTDGGETWRTLESAPVGGGGGALDAIWTLTPGAAYEPGAFYAGVEPAGLFVSPDRGASWLPVRALNEHATRASWQAMGGGLALSDVVVDPRDGRRITVAVSAGGVYRSDDAGETWRAMNRGVRACFQPDQFPPSGQCVHKLVAHPADPDRLYQQNHCGTYRSDDGGESWIDVTSGLPSDYGYALAVAPRDPNCAFVVPETSSHMRTVVAGRLRVYRTDDAGATWHPLEDGLPQRDAWVSVLREGLATDDAEPCGVYLGTSSGHVFASRNGGGSWREIAAFLPGVLCVRALGGSRA